ncbi:MAG: NUDIX hydrolase [Candidatus Levybacteria bacterium]|nr:NUDIX hydrolase [Candidatus Levybacteria bacterium]
MNKFQKALELISTKTYIDQKVLRVFAAKAKDENFVREENPTEHFCSFFMPVDNKTHRIFLGHHIKAQDWIPPGGHIEKGESPEETVRREFTEELGYTLKKENIKLFDISIIHVRSKARPCKIHYDFWHMVEINEQPFQFDKKEFYDAKWFTLREALQKTQRKEYKAVIKRLYQNLT